MSVTKTQALGAIVFQGFAKERKGAIAATSSLYRYVKNRDRADFSQISNLKSKI